MAKQDKLLPPLKGYQVKDAGRYVCFLEHSGFQSPNLFYVTVYKNEDGYLCYRLPGMQTLGNSELVVATSGYTFYKLPLP